MPETLKIVVYVPETHADAVREAMGKADAGLIGDYKYTSFSVKGTGRFIPMKNAHPSIGKIGELTEVAEERIETACLRKDLDKIIEAIKSVHPYEEVAIDVFPLLLDPNTITKNKLRNK